MNLVWNSISKPINRDARIKRNGVEIGFIWPAENKGVLWWHAVSEIPTRHAQWFKTKADAARWVFKSYRV